MGYRRVTSEDRLRIKDGLDAGLTNAEIADKLGFHRSTIGREIRRNKGGRGYRPKQAHRLASEREASKHGPYKMNPVIMTQITERLEMKWSPEQISNRLRLEGEESVSAETIYKFIDEDRSQGGELWRHLRRSSRTRKRRFPCYEKKSKVKVYFCDPYSSYQRGTNASVVCRNPSEVQLKEALKPAVKGQKLLHRCVGFVDGEVLNEHNNISGSRGQDDLFKPQ
jgi:IS30 family transposase